MTTLIFTWRDWAATAGLVSIVPLGYTKDGPALVVPRPRVVHVTGAAAVDVTPYAGHVVELRWTPQGVAEPYVQTVIVPASGEAHALDLDRVDPGTLEPLPEGMPSAVDLVARAEALVARIESGEFTGADGVGVESITDEDGDGVAEVRLSDGTTSMLALPVGGDGADGVSIVDVTAADGVATVSLSDGTTRRIPLPPGEAGRTPVLTWEGTRLLVDGVPGPDLRGPAGPAPSVAWAGDRLTVGGQTGPSLTGPASTVPGPAPSIRIGAVTSGSTPSATITGTSPDLTLGLVLPKGDPGAKGETGAPGVVSSASAYVLVGPGRPDVPSTTAGTITGAEPVGAEYRSTDGAQVGAWVWRKRPNGWTCPDLDTLNRYITADAALLPAGGEAVIRRIGSRVSLVLSGIPRAYNSTIFNIPDGFRSATQLNIGGQAKMFGAGGVFQTVTYQGSGLGPRMHWGGTFIRYHGTATADSLADVHASWHSNQPPPASLPGVGDLYSY